MESVEFLDDCGRLVILSLERGEVLYVFPKNVSACVEVEFIVLN